MLTNTFNTSALVAPHAVALLKGMNSLVNLGVTEYTGMYSNAIYKPGDTISLRKDNFVTVSRGQAASAQAIVEDTIPVTIRPLYSAMFEIRPEDLQRKIVDFVAEVVQPAVRAISAQIDSDIAEASKTEISRYIGDISAPMNTFKSVSNINPLMDLLGMNNYDRYLVLDPANSNELVSSDYLKNSFLQTLNQDITMNARVGRLADFDLFKDTNIVPHVTGTHAAAGDVTVKTAVSSGSTIVLQGFNAGATIKAGDCFTFDAVYDFDLIRQAPLSIKRQFTVTADATADGAGDVSVSVFPALIADGPRQNFYVPGASPNVIPVNAVVTFLTNTTDGYVNNIAFTGKGLVLAMPPLVPLDAPYSAVHTDPSTGISMRVTKTSDINNAVNIMRIDCQMACKWIDSQAVRRVAQNVVGLNA